MSGRRKHFAANDRGSALLAALLLSTVMGIALASYIHLCSQTLALSTRNQQSSRSLELAENGLEQALWSLNNANFNGYTFTTGSNGIHIATLPATPVTLENNLSGATDLEIDNYDGATSGPRTIIAKGTTTLSDGTNIIRTLTATAASAVLFPNAIAAVDKAAGKVEFLSSASGIVDSYDSSLGPYDSSNPGAGAVVTSLATTSSTATVQLSNTNVYGYIATTRVDEFQFGNSAVVAGSLIPISPTVNPARLSTSPYQPVFDVAVPSGTSTPLNPTAAMTIGNPAGTAASLYTLGVSVLNTQLTIDGPVILIIPNDATINGGIQITSTQVAGKYVSSLVIYCEGSLTINGSAVTNATMLARRLTIISADAPAHPETPIVSFNYTGDFYGSVYAPKGAITVSNPGPNIYGSLVGANVIFNGATSLHYDLDLRRAVFPGVVTPYTISNWQESTTH